MTGNSLDAADVVLTAFYNSGEIRDLEFLSLPIYKDLYKKLKDLRSYINKYEGEMKKVSVNYSYQGLSFDDVLNEYMAFVAEAVFTLIKKAKSNAAISSDFDLDNVDIIGFHGQTCAHRPPSHIVDKSRAYTVQIGDGQKLADLTGVAVVYDFRSDDLMHGGEGAPFAPKHNQHCAYGLKKSGIFPVTFINGGNTSNIAHVSIDDKGGDILSGWDAGPFNHFPDMLVRKYTDKNCDMDGEIGKAGKVNLELLKELFDESAVKLNGENFLLAKPVKSSDPEWYKFTPLLEKNSISFEDKVRTAEYFSAYLTYHSLSHTAERIVMPAHFVLFGGGWKNPVIKEAFEALVRKEVLSLPVLPEHSKDFANINRRIKYADINPSIKFSDKYGFSADATEARIFADMARCRITGVAFTKPETTGVYNDVICGLLSYPQGQSSKISENLRNWIEYYNMLEAECGIVFDNRWSRAAAGWSS